MTKQEGVTSELSPKDQATLLKFLERQRRDKKEGYLTSPASDVRELFAKLPGYQKMLEQRVERTFGIDCIGESAYRTIEERCKRVGIGVQFVTEGIIFPYTEEQVAAIQAEIGTGRERFFVLHPRAMMVEKKGRLIEKPITISALTALFGNKNPFGSGQLIDPYNERDNFVYQRLQAGWGAPCKSILSESTSKAYFDKRLLMSGERGRTVVESFFESLMRYASTEGRIVPWRSFDRTTTISSDDYDLSAVSVGGWMSGDRGLQIIIETIPTESPAIGFAPTMKGLYPSNLQSLT